MAEGVVAPRGVGLVEVGRDEIGADKPPHRLAGRGEIAAAGIDMVVAAVESLLPRATMIGFPGSAARNPSATKIVVRTAKARVASEVGAVPSAASARASKSWTRRSPVRIAKSAEAPYRRERSERGGEEGMIGVLAKLRERLIRHPGEFRLPGFGIGGGERFGEEDRLERIEMDVREVDKSALFGARRVTVEADHGEGEQNTRQSEAQRASALCSLAPGQAKRSAARARAFAASSSRFFGGAVVSSEEISRRAAAATSSIARSKAASFAFDGLVKPLSLRTNWIAEARISSSVAGGSKLNSVRMLRHIGSFTSGDCRHYNRARGVAVIRA